MPAAILAGKKESGAARAVLTAAFRVGAQLLVGEFGHLPPCVRKWQQKPRREKKPEFARHVCSVWTQQRKERRNLLGLVVSLSSQRRRFSDRTPHHPTNPPPPPPPHLSCMGTHRAPFRVLKQVNRMGPEKSRRVTLDRPPFVWRPQLRLQCPTVNNTFL